MSIFDDVRIEIDEIIDEAKEFAADGIAFLKEKGLDYLSAVPLMAVQKAVAIIKETALGTAIMNLISAASHKDMTGVEKFNAVLDAAMDAYKAYVDNGGLSGIIEIGVNVLRQTIQALYDNFVATFKTA